MSKGSIRVGLAVGLAAFIGLVVTSGQFVPPQPPSGGGGIQAFTCPAGQYATSCTAAGVCSCAAIVTPATTTAPYNICSNPNYKVCQSDNLVGGLFNANPMTCLPVSGGTANAYAIDGIHIGLVQGQTGLNAGQIGGWGYGFGNVCYGTGTNLLVVKNASTTYHLFANVSFDTAGSAGNNVLVRFGFNQAYTGTANGTDAVQAVYDSSASGNWELETRTASASTITPTSCSVDFNAATFELLEVRLTNTGHAMLFKNGVQCADTTTGVPTAAMTAGSTWQKINTGATNTHPLWDWLAFATE